MSFPRYADYQDSGVDWLGPVPAHWQVGPLKHRFNVVSGSTPRSDVRAYWDGDIPWATPADLRKEELKYVSETGRTITPLGLRSCGTTLVPPEAIILSTRAPIGSLAIAAVALCTNQGCRSLVSHTKVIARYVGYLLLVSSAPLNARGRGTTFLELPAHELAGFRVAWPPLTEQAAIATFLDRETGKIDALVAEQERLIELLKEKRQAVISQAVTKGIDSAVPTKRLNVEWLAEIPTHWSVEPLKYSITRVEQGTSPNCLSEPAADGEWGVLKVGCGNAEQFDPAEQKALPGDVQPEPRYEVRAGDILMSRGNTTELVGAATLVPHIRPKLLLSDLLYRFRARESHADPEYLVMVLRSSIGRFQIERSATGTSPSMKKIGQNTVRSLRIPLPPIGEQVRIVESVRDITNRVDDLVASAREAINRLHERRAALISAAVTGQIDVRGLVTQEVA